jgi:uncharacterized membrane protein YhaH (DUF805 family)
MANFGRSISYNLGQLTRFEGRDAPRHYWPYIGVLVAVNFLGGLAISVPLIWDAFVTSFQAVGQEAAGAPPPDPEMMTGLMMQQIFENTRAMLPWSIGLSLIIDGLALAATVRRLHDRNWSGWWASLLFVSLVIAQGTNWWMMSLISEHGVDALVDQMGLLQLLGWLPWVGYIVLLIQLVQRGDVGDNRFGPEPDQSW